MMIMKENIQKNIFILLISVVLGFIIICLTTMVYDYYKNKSSKLSSNAIDDIVLFSSCEQINPDIVKPIVSSSTTSLPIKTRSALFVFKRNEISDSLVNKSDFEKKYNCKLNFNDDVGITIDDGKNIMWIPLSFVKKHCLYIDKPVQEIKIKVEE